MVNSGETRGDKFPCMQVLGANLCTAVSVATPGTAGGGLF